MLKRVVCSVLNLLVIILQLNLVSCQLPADQVNAMTSIYEIIQNDRDDSFFVWNNVLKTSNPCSWEGVGCTSDNSSIKTISFHNFTISTPEFLPALCNISTLESLDVSYNKLSSIPDGFITVCGEISRLKVLNFSGNWLYVLPSFTHGFRMLEKLDFSDNDLYGEISLQLDGLDSLKFLDLSRNGFKGKIPTNLGKMNLLEELHLSSNMFKGEIPLEITKYKNLSVIDLRSNWIIGPIPWQFGEFTKLQTLDLSYNFLFGGIPASLFNITTLVSFAAVQNNLNGTIPSGMTWHLKYLSLRLNRLTGFMPSDSLSGPNLQTVDLSYNYFEGPIPTINSTTLLELRMDNNTLLGTLPPSLGNLTNLQVLNLKFNNFMGEIPEEFSQLDQLEELNIFGNSLNGSIPWSISRMQSIRVLDLHGNKLGGSIPDSVGNLSSLIHLKLGNNQLNGLIPDSLSRLHNLEILYLQGNKLGGPIPNSIGNLSSLFQLLLGNNQLNEQIPNSLSRLTTLQVLDMEGNNLQGGLPDSFRYLSSLDQLQLGNNQLNGPIPDMPQGLTGVNLSYNLLVGRIPFSLSTLRGLRVLDLSNNRLSGEIPNYLTDLRSLYHLLLMNNDFSGVVPRFGNHVEVDTTGNKGLIYPSPAITPHKNTSKSSIDTDLVIVGVASGFPIGLLISLIAIFISRRYYNSIRSNLSTPNSIHRLNVDFKKGMEATTDPSNIILKSTFSTFYKAVMPSHATYLVKKINHSSKIVQFPRHKQLVEELELLGSLSNPNVMIPVAFLLTPRRAYLFYDFVRGTLHDILHRPMGNSTLDWARRYNIAVGVARGLAFLHECSSGPIILLNLSTKTILLKSIDEPQISDIELCKLIYPSPRASSLGYDPPEYGCTKRVTGAGNVYSFGVVLLELLTGKPAVSEGTKLANWVLSSSNCDQIFYSSISETETVRNQMLGVLEVAVDCINISPEMRPNMVNVVQMLLNTKAN